MILYRGYTYRSKLSIAWFSVQVHTQTERGFSEVGENKQFYSQCCKQLFIRLLFNSIFLAQRIVQIVHFSQLVSFPRFGDVIQ